MTPDNEAKVTEHMPTPWRMDVDQAGCKTLVSVDNDSYEIASHLDQSNAEFILRCVNERDQLVEALKLLFNMVSDGKLVRDISRDAHPDWAIASMELVMNLAKAEQAIALAEGRPE